MLILGAEILLITVLEPKNSIILNIFFWLFWVIIFITTGIIKSSKQNKVVSTALNPLDTTIPVVVVDEVSSLSIIGLVFSCIPPSVLGLLPMTVAPVGIVVSYFASRSANKTGSISSKKFAKTGLIIGFLNLTVGSFLGFALMMISNFHAVAEINHEMGLDLMPKCPVGQEFNNDQLSVAATQPLNVCSLSIQNKDLLSLPPEILGFKNLKGLWLQYGKINDLPPEFSDLKKLELLNLDSNQFNAVPEAVFNLPNLKLLDLSGNPLTQSNLDSARQRLKNVRIDYKYGPKLTQTSVTNMAVNKTVVSQPNMEQFALIGQQMDDKIGRYSDLSKAAKDPLKVKIISINFRGLTEFPDVILTMPNLTALYLAANEIKSVPAGIGNLSNLENINLDGNQIKSLPKEIGQLKKLKELSLLGNPISEQEINNIKLLLPNTKIAF